MALFYGLAVRLSLRLITLLFLKEGFGSQIRWTRYLYLQTANPQIMPYLIQSVESLFPMRSSITCVSILVQGPSWAKQQPGILMVTAWPDWMATNSGSINVMLGTCYGRNLVATFRRFRMNITTRPLIFDSTALWRICLHCVMCPMDRAHAGGHFELLMAF